MKKDLLYILLLAIMLATCTQVRAEARIGSKNYTDSELSQGFAAYLEYRGKIGRAHV